MSLLLNQSNTLGRSAQLNQKEPHVWITKVYISKRKKNQFPVQKKNIGKRPQQKDKQREPDQDSSRSGKIQLSIRQTSLAIGITLGSFHSPRSKI